MRSRGLLSLKAAFAALLVGSAGAVVAQASDPTMTVIIRNNSPNYNIYPVLSTGTATVDPFLQAGLGIPKEQLPSHPFPKLNQFRIYINPTGDGIPPGQSIALTLPLYSQLVPSDRVDPTKTDQYIDWWGGGRVEIFDSPAASHAPPPALTALFQDRMNQTVVAPINGTSIPTCASCQPLTFLKSPIGLKQNEPDQLTEYTLGALNMNKSPYELNAHNVDFDVSYVDTAYLPAAMEPVNNTQIGYVGTIDSIDQFRAALRKFLDPSSPFAGWPQLKDNQGEAILKIPSALHIFGGEVDLSPPPPWAPIEALKNNLANCTKRNGTGVLCPSIKKVSKLFDDNYESYVAQYGGHATCDHAQSPVGKTETRILQHIYGWGPFNENCDAQFNLLERTPGYRANNSEQYQKIKDIFDKLQNDPAGRFDPYVVLIHGADYINAPNVYAYSVDDAVGNMQADGDGFIIAVGGAQGLPNGRPATPPINVNFGYSLTDAVRFVSYGICTAPNKNVNPDFASFIVSIDNIDGCPLNLLDNTGGLYTFKIRSQPPYPEASKLTPATHAIIDCAGNARGSKSAEWCKQVFGYTVQGPSRGTSYIISPAPEQPPPAR